MSELEAAGWPIPVVGLTGGIASGKSTVSHMLRALGVTVLDADTIAREVVKPGHEGLRRVVSTFGEAMLLPDGSLDRGRLGGLVFKEEGARKKLNALLHPLVRQALSEGVHTASREGMRWLVMDVPLLFETGDPTRYAEVVVVSLDPATQLSRLMMRDSLSQEDALHRIHSQLSLEEKARRASFVIDNRGTRDETRTQTERWLVRAIERYGAIQ